MKKEFNNSFKKDEEPGLSPEEKKNRSIPPPVVDKKADPNIIAKLVGKEDNLDSPKESHREETKENTEPNKVSKKESESEDTKENFESNKASKNDFSKEESKGDSKSNNDNNKESQNNTTPSPSQMRDYFIDENIKKNKAKQLTIHVNESESTKIVYDMITEFSLITGFAPSDSFVGNMLLIMGRLIHDHCPNYRARLDHELGNLNSVNSVYKKQDEIQDFLLRILCDMMKDEYASKLRKELKI